MFFRKSSLARSPNYFPSLKKLKIWNLSVTDEEKRSSTPCLPICPKVWKGSIRDCITMYELLSEVLVALRRELEGKVSLRSELCEVEEQITLAEYQISALQNTWYQTHRTMELCIVLSTVPMSQLQFKYTTSTKLWVTLSVLLNTTALRWVLSH